PAGRLLRTGRRVPPDETDRGGRCLDVPCRAQPNHRSRPEKESGISEPSLRHRGGLESRTRESPPIHRRGTGCRLCTAPVDYGAGRRAGRADAQPARGVPGPRIRGTQFSRARGGEWFERKRVAVTEAPGGQTTTPTTAGNLRRSAQKVGGGHDDQRTSGENDHEG